MTSHTNTTVMPLAARVQVLGDTSEAVPRTPLALRVPEGTVDAMRAALLGGETHYTSRPGMPALRARVADAVSWLGGPACDPATSIVITAGTRESLFVVLLGLRLGSGNVLVAGGTANEYASLFGLMDLVPLDLPQSPPDTARLLYRHVEGGQTEHRAILGIGELRGLVDVLNVGEAIGTASPRSLPPLSADRTIVIGSLDALPGVRAFGVGFVAGPPALVARIRTWKQAFSICTAAPSQRAALVAIDAWWKEAQ